MTKEARKVVCRNKKAFHDYHIDETFEAGLALVGCEVKSLRAGKANLKDGYAVIRSGEVFLFKTHISPYPQADRFTAPDPERTRKLLLHKGEIKRLIGKTQEKGYSLIPLNIFFQRGKAKVELALAKGKKLYDKREDLKQKAIKREVEREAKV